jgi:flagellar basal-body rod protein FlgC
MAFLNSINIAASGLTAQQLRLDVISENITNSQTTRTEGGGAYRRKMVLFQSESGKESVQKAMSRVADGLVPSTDDKIVGGVRVAGIEEDQSDLKLVYDPTHPDANEDGYVELPNVDMVKEIADAMAATQAYSANVTAINTLKTVISKGLEIGR